jgi:hypothetical protein
VPGNAWVNLGPNSGVQTSPLYQLKTDSGRAQKIVPHPTDPNILYFATSGGGVWKSFDAQAPITGTAGPHWTSITDPIGSQSIGAFALDPASPDTLFVGLGDPFDVHSPGFFHSADGGATWSAPITLHGSYGTGGADYAATSTRDIVVDPSRSGVVLVATDAGLFRSTEGGISESWQLLDLDNHLAQDCWSVAWVGAQTWLATCSRHVWRSIDNGASWLPDRGLPTSDLSRMTLAAAPGDSASPDSARVYLLAANQYGDDQKDIFASYNGGQSWSSLNMLGTAACQPTCRTPKNPNNDQPDLDVLHDQAWYNQAIIVDPRNNDRLFVGGNLATLRSQDGGRTWDVISDWLPPMPTNNVASRLPYVHADYHAMAISTTGASPYFYAGTDGGLFRSSTAFTGDPPQSSYPSQNCYNGQPTDASSPRCISFDDRLNRGIISHLAYSIATDEHDSSNLTLIGGLQDNGTRQRVPGSPTTFNQVIGGDGFGVGIGISTSNYTPPSCNGKWGSLLVGTIYTAIWRSIDCAGNFQLAMNGICSSPSLLSGNPCSIDYSSNFFMKIASEQADPSGQTLLTVINNSACSASASQCSPAATSSVYVTHNGAASWQQAGNALPAQLRFVGTNSLRAGQWAVATSSSAYTLLAGETTWTASSALPSPGVSSVAFEGTTGRILWATTKSGAAGSHVFRSADRGATWVDKSGKGLPAVPANTVKVDPNDSATIYLGTELGLYRSIDGGFTWSRYGTGLPLVSATEMNVALNSSAIRISTFGRGFWELYASSGAVAGVLGNGDFDRNQLIDGLDLIHEAALLGTTTEDPDYDQTANLVGTTNGIDGADFGALVGKLGGSP